MPDQPTDSFILLQRHRDGEAHALEQLLERHYPRVERIVRIKLGRAMLQRVEVADVVQDSIIKAAQHLDEFEPRDDARLIHWMARFVENEIRDLIKFHRAEKRDARREVAIDGLRPNADHSAGGFDIAGSNTSIPARVAKREEGDFLDACLGELPEHYREVIILRKYVGGSWAFVMEAMGRSSEGAVQKLYERAHHALKAALKSRLGPDPE